MRGIITKTFLCVLWGLAGWSGAAHATGEITPGAIPVCYNFGCSIKDVVSITPGEWTQVTNWFSEPAGNAEQERTQIKKAVGWLEVIVGRYTPIYRDLGQDDLSQGRLGQMDCIDEEKNVTAFLQLFQNQGLLRFHRVAEPAYRRMRTSSRLLKYLITRGFVVINSFSLKESPNLFAAFAISFLAFIFNFSA